MSAVIRAIGFANGTPCPHRGEWVKSFEHDAHGGQGFAVFTDDIDDAMRFGTKAAALQFWSQQSTVQPLRPDGKPNKPMTALTVMIEELV
jgi:hypothetical protein